MSEDQGKEALQRLTPQSNAAIIPLIFEVEAREFRQARQVAVTQLAVTLIVATLVYGMSDAPQSALAVLSGGGVSVVNGTLLAWRMTRAAMISDQNAHLQLRLIYFYAAERFLVVVALLSMCIAVLKLLPLAVVGGFVLGQVTLLTARLVLSRFR